MKLRCRSRANAMGLNANVASSSLDVRARSIVAAIFWLVVGPIMRLPLPNSGLGAYL
jgi:hypothetical protein